MQWLGFWALTAKGMGSIPGQGTKIWEAAAWCGQKIKICKESEKTFLQMRYRKGLYAYEQIQHIITLQYANRNHNEIPFHPH